jgi:hypothetical protein
VKAVSSLGIVVAESCVAIGSLANVASVQMLDGAQRCMSVARTERDSV